MATTRTRRIGIEIAVVAAAMVVAGFLLRAGIWQGVGTRHYAANGVEFDYPSAWTIHDKIPGSTGLGSEFLILGTLPWGPCAEYDINCHYQQKLDPGQVTIQLGRLAISTTDLCELGATSGDLAGRGPGDPPATRTLLRIAGRPAFRTDYAVGGTDYYLADEWRNWDIAEPGTAQGALTIQAMYRGPDVAALRAQVDELAASLRWTGPAPYPVSGSDCAAPFPVALAPA